METLLVIALAIAPPSNALPMAPVPVVSRSSPEPSLLTWTTGVVRCGDKAVQPVAMRQPLSGLHWGPVPPTMQPAAIRFRIDATGRPLSIRNDRSGFIAGAADLVPALAASVFPAGSAQEDCTVRYTARIASFEQSSIDDMIAYSVAPQSGALPDAGWDRMWPAGTTCRQMPRPAPLRLSFPDYESLRGTRGVRDWSAVQFDTDRQGRPVNVRLRAGTGNPALDKAAVAAIRASRYTQGPRIGCLSPFARAAEPLPPPPMPSSDGLRPAGSQCAVERPWTTPLRLVYPANLRGRGIEGWAVVAYDVAPWGEPGNVRILASEPAAEFGDAASRLIRQGRKPASPTGQSGCIDKVRYKMQDMATEMSGAGQGESQSVD